MKKGTTQIREQWLCLAKGERRLITSIMNLLKSAKRSRVKEVARAAAQWESAIAFFIKLRLMHRRIPRPALRNRIPAPN